jgi:hypothetical protein
MGKSKINTDLLKFFDIEGEVDMPRTIILPIQKLDLMEAYRMTALDLAEKINEVIDKVNADVRT